LQYTQGRIAHEVLCFAALLPRSAFFRRRCSNINATDADSDTFSDALGVVHASAIID
jgi:hypothetical protein